MKLDTIIHEGNYLPLRKAIEVLNKPEVMVEFKGISYGEYGQVNMQFVLIDTLDTSNIESLSMNFIDERLGEYK